jgi:hypothetical protein
VGRLAGKNCLVNMGMDMDMDMDGTGTLIGSQSKMV